MKVILDVTRGDYAGRSFTFDAHDTFLFGRGADCHYLLPEDDRTASRHHFLLEICPPRVALVDLGGRNGTHVNGARVNTPDAKHAHAIKDGDEIAVGKTTLKVRVEHPARALSTVEADVVPQVLGVPRDALARFDVEGTLGDGGMGTVYRARDRQSGEVLALKVMKLDVAVSDDARARFVREMDVMRALVHPHIVGFRGAGAADDGLYLAMELCAGGDALAHVRARGLMTERALLEWAEPLCDALACAHDANIIHRDIKPENMFLDDKGAPKLADFGLAKSLDAIASLSLTGQAAGTPEFMPKAQLLNFKRATPEVDVFALAASFYYLLSGHFPRAQVPGLNRFLAVLRQPPRPLREVLPSVSTGLAAAIDDVLANDAIGFSARDLARLIARPSR